MAFQLRELAIPVTGVALQVQGGAGLDLQKGWIDVRGSRNGGATRSQAGGARDGAAANPGDRDNHRVAGTRAHADTGIRDVSIQSQRSNWSCSTG